MVGAANLAVLACVLTATIKKGRGKKCTPEKILATPMLNSSDECETLQSGCQPSKP